MAAHVCFCDREKKRGGEIHAHRFAQQPKVPHAPPLHCISPQMIWFAVNDSLHSNILVDCLFVACVLKFAHIKCVCVGVQRETQQLPTNIYLTYYIKYNKAYQCLMFENSNSCFRIFPMFPKIIGMGVAKISKSAFKSVYWNMSSKNSHQILPEPTDHSCCPY